MSIFCQYLCKMRSISSFSNIILSFTFFSFVFCSKKLIDLSNKVIIFELTFEILLNFCHNLAHSVFIIQSFFIDSLSLECVIFCTELIETTRDILIILDKLIKNIGCILYFLLSWWIFTCNNIINSLIQNL